jgi:hypothetical protein
MKSGINIRPLQPVMLQQTLSDQGGTHVMKEYGISFPNNQAIPKSKNQR